MFKLTHLIVALLATVAVASPAKLVHADCQVPFSISLQQPPPLANSILFDYFSVTDCSTVQDAVYELFGNICYYLPGEGADLLYLPCSNGGFRSFVSAFIPLVHSPSY
jgi:hypothetical protein